jgi:hypothetical protein
MGLCISSRYTLLSSRTNICVNGFILQPGSYIDNFVSALCSESLILTSAKLRLYSDDQYVLSGFVGGDLSDYLSCIKFKYLHMKIDGNLFNASQLEVNRVFITAQFKLYQGCSNYVHLKGVLQDNYDGILELKLCEDGLSNVDISKLFMTEFCDTYGTLANFLQLNSHFILTDISVFISTKPNLKSLVQLHLNACNEIHIVQDRIWIADFKISINRRYGMVGLFVVKESCLKLDSSIKFVIDDMTYSGMADIDTVGNIVSYDVKLNYSLSRTHFETIINGLYGMKRCDLQYLEESMDNISKISIFGDKILISYDLTSEYIISITIYANAEVIVFGMFQMSFRLGLEIRSDGLCVSNIHGNSMTNDTIYLVDLFPEYIVIPLQLRKLVFSEPNISIEKSYTNMSYSIRAYSSDSLVIGAICYEGIMLNITHNKDSYTWTIQLEGDSFLAKDTPDEIQIDNTYIHLYDQQWRLMATMDEMSLSAFCKLFHRLPISKLERCLINFSFTDVHIIEHLSEDVLFVECRVTINENKCNLKCEMPNTGTTLFRFSPLERSQDVLLMITDYFNNNLMDDFNWEFSSSEF